MITMTNAKHEELTELTPWELARMAEVAEPDNAKSPGADWLDTIRRDALDTYAENENGRDAVHEMADALVPIYTYNKWQVFTDLAAWQEDVSDFGPIENMDNGAGIALYMIAERLINALWDELDEINDDTEGEES